MPTVYIDSVAQGAGDIVAATLVVAASNSLHPERADYQCDGVNDEVQIQMAIDALPIVPGGRVELLDGTLNLGAPISIQKSNVSLVGQGVRSTKLFLSAASNCHVIDVGGGTTTVEGIFFSGFTIDGNRLNQTGGDIYLVYLHGVGAHLITDCICSKLYLKSSQQHGINFSYTKYSVIEDCHFTDNNEDACALWWSDNNIVQRVHSYSNTDWGIRLYDSEKNIIAECECFDNGFDGIILDGGSNDNIVVNNICTGQDGLNRAGITVYDDSNQNLIASNRCSGNTYGINIKENDCDDNIVIGNVLFDNVTAALNDVGICTVVMNNQGTEITDVRDLVKVTNTSGGALAAGDVVILKSVAAGNEITTTAVLGSDKVFGMVAEAIADTASGLVLVRGKTTVLSASNDHGAIVIGDFLCTNDTAKECCLAAAGNMAFAIALEDCDAANQAIDALLVSSLKV